MLLISVCFPKLCNLRHIEKSRNGSRGGIKRKSPVLINYSYSCISRLYIYICTHMCICIYVGTHTHMYNLLLLKFHQSLVKALSIIEGNTNSTSNFYQSLTGGRGSDFRFYFSCCHTVHRDHSLDLNLEPNSPNSQSLGLKLWLRLHSNCFLTKMLT